MQYFLKAADSVHDLIHRKNPFPPCQSYLVLAKNRAFLHQSTLHKVVSLLTEDALKTQKFNLNVLYNTV